MKNEWIVLANASTARLFSRESDRHPLVPLVTLDHAASQQKTSALADDRMGHGSADSRPGGVAFEPRTSALRKEHAHFARELAQRLADGLASGACDRITLYASAPFLGELKAQLSPAAAKALRAAFAVDLTSFQHGELERRIAHELHALEHPGRSS
jgi:protein required for attachment to host cells